MPGTIESQPSEPQDVENWGQQAAARLSLVVNGEAVTLAVRPFATLLEALRDELELTGTKYGCGEGECGACSVLLDGRVVNACLVLALECADAEVLTIEGLTSNGDLHPLQRAFHLDNSSPSFDMGGIIIPGIDLENNLSLFNDFTRLQPGMYFDNSPGYLRSNGNYIQGLDLTVSCYGYRDVFRFCIKYFNLKGGLRDRHLRWRLS